MALMTFIKIVFIILGDIVFIILGMLMYHVINAKLGRQEAKDSNEQTTPEKSRKKEKDEAVNRYWRLASIMRDEVNDLYYNNSWSTSIFTTHTKPIVTILQGLLKMLADNQTDHELAKKIETSIETLLMIHCLDNSNQAVEHTDILKKRLKVLLKDLNEYYENRLNGIGETPKPKEVEQQAVEDVEINNETLSPLLELKRQYKKMEKGDTKDVVSKIVQKTDNIYKSGNKELRLFSKLETFYLPELVSLIKRYNKLSSPNEEQKGKIEEAIQMLDDIFEKLLKELTRDENEAFELSLETLKDVAKMDGLIDDFAK